MAVAEWNKTKINLLDTPGFNIFIQETRASLVAADSVLILVDGVAGVEVQTEKVYNFAKSSICRTRSLSTSSIASAPISAERGEIHEVFGRTRVPIQLPIGCEKNFKGVVDLISMKAYAYTPDGDGKGKEVHIPADMAEAAKRLMTRWWR